MNYIFEIIDKTGRKIRLTKKIWSKIRKKHYEIEDKELILETLNKPDKIENYEEGVIYYYKYYKNKLLPKRFLLVVVKYLNGNGFVITSYFIDKIG
ncbi:hypothetical protein HYT25_02045 [Candidatus Pacearchaeota archaeon]|nr:hypothetical protein [Candidatus Pacearchaeota archaeon]